MIWIILAGLFFILFIASIVLAIVESDSDCGGVIGAMFAIFLIFGLILLGVVYSGTSDYPQLNAKYKSVQLMRVRVNDIRNAYYKNETKASLIAGSIENVKQSTTLSEAISSLTIKEREYISARENIIFAKDSFIYKWFLDGMFISDKVKNLPDLDKEKL